MPVKEEKQKSDGQIENIRYSGAIPAEILNELTPEIIEQYFIWDEVTKRELELHPWLILPLIKEVFHKVYPEDAEIKLLATEYVVRRLHKEGCTTINSIYADIAVQIGNRDIYHLECQMKQNKEMVLRMLEYDIHIGLVHGIERPLKDMSADSKPEVMMPRSVILYLGYAGDVPAEEVCRIRFADGTSHEYRVPVVKVQDYTPEMIRNKHLNMLIPYLPIRFGKHINKKKAGIKIPASETVRKNLTEFIRECIMIIDREKRNGTLTDMAGKDIIEFLSITCGYLLKDEPELKREVHEIMEPTILLTREKADIEIRLTREKADIEIKLIREAADEKIQRIQKETDETIQQIKEETDETIHQIKEEADEKIQQMKEETDEKVQQMKEETDEKVRHMQENVERMKEETDETIQQMKEEADEKQEICIKKTIERNQRNGQSRQEVKECIKEIFSMKEKEAEEKMSRYWKG